MSDVAALRRALSRIDGRSYPAYRDIEGSWSLPVGSVDAELRIDHVQGDPFASPSRLRLWIQTHIPSALRTTADQRLAVEDWLLRAFANNLGGQKRGSGKSGQLGVYRPGPEITERSAVRIHPDGTAEVRFTAGLPARGRRVLARQAEALLTEDVAAAAESLIIDDLTSLRAHVHSVQRQRALRRLLPAHGLVGFIGNGSILPRASGVSSAPLPGAVPFHSPPEHEVTLATPFGSVTGMGIRTGVTLITGGGFHGKSTVLSAIQSGHLDHLPSDGRHTVVALADTVKIRAEDGRRVERVNISAFLRDLPGGRSTRPFSTDDASGSTSQAATIIEAIEAGAHVLLLDEDTSATNLLVRDARMRLLIPDDREPITPFVHRVRQLAEQGVSTIMVVGGVSDYLAVADVVIAMTDWQPSDVTATAHKICPDRPSPHSDLPTLTARIPKPFSVRKVRARDTRAVQLDRTEIELVAVEQVLDSAHAATIGHGLRFLSTLADGHRTLPQLLNAVEAILDDEGVDVLSPWPEPSGALIRPRRHELASALNRYRALTVTHPNNC